MSSLDRSVLSHFTFKHITAPWNISHVYVNILLRCPSASRISVPVKHRQSNYPASRVPIDEEIVPGFHNKPTYRARPHMHRSNVNRAREPDEGRSNYCTLTCRIDFVASKNATIYVMYPTSQTYTVINIYNNQSLCRCTP